MSRRDIWPLGAIGFVLIVSAAWWGFALWSVPGAPEWLERTRSVCFNITETGLPDAKGWLLLVGQPPTMLAFLFVGWGGDVRATLGRLVSFSGGRMAAVTVVTVVVTGLSLAAYRVLDARLPEIAFGVDEPAPETYPRLDRPWPITSGLVAQDGEAFDLARLGGRPALVTFAFGHCATICPLVVHQARAVRLELDRDFAVVVFTLDPWRDTPGRLPSLVEQFDLDASDFLVSGSVDDVNRVLDAWNMPRERDPITGDVTHPGVVYLIEPDGTVAYGSTGGVAQIESLARRLR